MSVSRPLLKPRLNQAKNNSFLIKKQKTPRYKQGVFCIYSQIEINYLHLLANSVGTISIVAVLIPNLIAEL